MLVITTACAQRHEENVVPPPSRSSNTSSTTMSTQTLDTATLGGGCFWCIEAVYQRLDGVTSVVSGYSGGSVPNPTYRIVGQGNSGHAEVCQITFDCSKVSFSDVLHVFFSAHDPTTLNRQGNDVGTQYRSVIFYHDDEQKKIAEDYIAQLEAAKTWPDPIVTEISPFTVFYKAEDYHQNYFNQNGSQPYCAFVVRPKVEKFMKQFKDRVRQ
ncbi:MAG: peptide-methionine (S)-S-oxide reductase MsrA ['Candidatus Kapabacteria' thiocyanatum]|nr:peptide-methionine (S)-S-oxide reductase MsrA ['Candidatus Kapabacteria' thiocyanatum]